MEGLPPAVRRSRTAAHAPWRERGRRSRLQRSGRGGGALLLLLHAACGLPPREPTPPPRPADYFLEAQLVLDSNGNTCVAAIEHADREERVAIAMSTRFGEDWGELRPLTRAPRGRRRYLSLAEGAPGEVYAVWADTRQGGVAVYFNRSLDGGATWMSEDRRVNGGGPARSHPTAPMVCCDDRGDVYVVWLDDHEGFEAIYVNRSRDRGDTWLAADRRATPLSLGRKAQPQAACDSDGDLYLAWMELRDGVRRVYFNASTDYGETWMFGDLQLSGTGQALAPALEAFDGGVVVVAWLEGGDTSGRVLCARSTDRARSFEASRAIGGLTRIGGSSPVRVLGDDQGHVYVACQVSGADGVPRILLAASRDSGARFSELLLPLGDFAPGILDPTPDPSQLSFGVTADGAGNVYFAWLEPAMGAVRVGFGRVANFGRTVVPVQPTLDLEARLDLGLEAAPQVPQLAADDFGHVCLLWNVGSTLEIAVSPFNGDSGWRRHTF